MRCPICKKAMMLPWEHIEEIHGVQDLVRGTRCESCGETLVRADELRRHERTIAMRLVVRGVKNGEQFKFVRKAAGLRAVDLAGLLGVDAKTISRWETGETPIPRAELFVMRELIEQPVVARKKLEALAAS